MDIQKTSIGSKAKRARKRPEEAKENIRRKKNREKMKRYRIKLKTQQEDMEEENDTLKVQVMQLNQQVDSLSKENQELKAKIAAMKSKCLSPSQSTSLRLRSNKKSAFEKIETKEMEKEGSSLCCSSASKEPTISACEKIFKRENHFWQNILPNLIQKNPEKVKYTLMEQNKDIADVNGAARISFLKSQFRNIIQNVLPFNAIVTLLVFDEFKIEQWIKLRNKLSDPAPDLSNLEVPSDFTIFKLSDPIVKFFTHHGKDLITNLREIRSLMQSLVKTRNKLFRRLKELSDLYKKSEYKYDKNDHIAAKNKWDEYKAKGVDLFHIWKIAKKQSDSEYISDFEMSEWEEE
ncbi:unnamed protein product [Moneuplotes crassus]|uniref:BZIP domain-containing protein n=1 Tax=Euplotes crassus TaxID=5936 RepID=A0AAD1XBL2_EUPCR|nr:unnamed protein product [Moneuplotes crassus]